MQIASSIVQIFFARPGFWKNALQHSLPNLRRRQRNLVSPPTRSPPDGVEGRFSIAIRKQNASIAEGKQRRSKIRCCDAHGMSMVPQHTVIEFRKRRDASLNACADGGRPQHTTLAKLDSPFTPLRKEPLYLRIRCACEKEKLVKVALPSKLRLAGRQPRILRKFPKRERSQGHYRHAGLFGKCLQGVSRRRQRLRRRNAGKPPKSQRGSFP